MQINNITTTPKDNNLHFGAIKKINYLGEYSKYPEFGKELLSILGHSPRFEAFCKKYDVDITFNTKMPRITPIIRMGYCIGDKSYIGKRLHTMHLDAHIPNLNFLKSLFTKNKKVELDIVTFDSNCNLSPIWAPYDSKLFEAVKEVNKKLVGFVERSWSLDDNERYKCVNKFQIDGYKFINTAHKKAESLCKDINRSRYRIPYKIEEQISPHYDLIGFNCKNCGYYPNGNLKSYICLGDDFSMYGECYENGKKKCELISQAKSIVHGRGAIEHTNTIKVNLYREDGSLYSNKEFDSKGNIYSLLGMYIPSFGTPQKRLCEEEWNILEACRTLQAREENKHLPLISHFARTINDNTWLLSDDSVLIKENGRYERITPKKIYTYDENLDEILVIDKYGCREGA